MKTLEATVKVAHNRKLRYEKYLELLNMDIDAVAAEVQFTVEGKKMWPRIYLSREEMQIIIQNMIDDEKVTIDSAMGENAKLLS